LLRALAIALASPPSEQKDTKLLRRVRARNCSVSPLYGSAIASVFMVKPVANISGSTTSESFPLACVGQEPASSFKFAALFSHVRCRTEWR
jgi:hypothetical protein